MAYMRIRRYVYQLMLASPVLFLGSIVIESRASEPAFEPLSYSEVTDRSIAKYAPYVSRLDRVLASRRHEQPDEIIALAAFWADGIRSGNLEPIPSMNSLDSMRSGVKGQLRVDAIRVNAHLLNLAHQIKNDRPSQALELAEDGLTVARHFRDWDLFAYSTFSMQERGWLGILKDIARDADEAERKRIWALAEPSKKSVERLDLLISRAERLYMAEGERWGEQRVSYFDLADRLADPDGFDSASRILAQASSDEDAAGGSDAPADLLMATQAAKAQERTLKELKKVLHSK
jgi:hypothetical protein